MMETTRPRLPDVGSESPPSRTVGLTRRPRTPRFLGSALRVLDLTLGGLLWSRRTVFMGLVIGVPVVIALVLRGLVSLELFTGSGSPGGEPWRVSGPAIFGLMVWGFYLRFTVPVLGVFYGTALIADEVEDKTLTYLFTRPVPRGAVLLGKYLAYLVCTTVVVLPSLVLVYFLVVPLLGGQIGANFPSLVIDVGLLALGLSVYGGVFALVGASFKYPLLTGLVFVFGWEPIAVAVPGYLKHFTVAHYLQGLVPHTMPADGTVALIRAAVQAFEAPSSVWSNLACLLVIWVGSLVAAIRVVERREYQLDQ